MRLLLPCVLFSLFLACEDRRPSLPITLASRPAMFGEGLVVQFKNESDRHLVFKLVLQNKTLDEKKVDSISLGPRQMKEIGWAEGWQFMSSETVTMWSTPAKMSSRLAGSGTRTAMPSARVSEQSLDTHLRAANDSA